MESCRDVGAIGIEPELHSRAKTHYQMYQDVKVHDFLTKPIAQSRVRVTLKVTASKEVKRDGRTDGRADRHSD